MATTSNKNNAFQSALDEAQQLMDDIDIHTEGGVAASFTIDDDDDYEVDDCDDDDMAADASLPKISGSHPLAAATTAATATTTLNDNGSSNGVKQLDDPLSVLASQSPLRVDTASTNLYYTPNAATSSTSPYSSFTNNNLDLNQQPPASQLLKQQAQKFGSDAQRMAASMFHLAQQAASNMASTSDNVMMQQNYNNNMNTQMQMQQQLQLQQQQSITTTNTVTAASSTPPELDKEQKLELLKTVVDLLEGEQVIMFLNHLLHVSDSSGQSYYYNTVGMPRQQVIGCAMTFYRVIIFGYDEQQQLPTNSSSGASDSVKGDATSNSSATIVPLLTRQEPALPPADWNVSCWPRAPTKLLMQIPLSSLERVEKSVFSTSSSNGMNSPSSGNSSNNNLPSSSSSMMGLVLTGKDNQRVLRITTASYQDTIRAHQALQTYAFPGRRNLGYLFAFESRRLEVMKSLQQQKQPAAVADPTTPTGQQQQQSLAQSPSPSTPIVTCEPTRARFTMSEFQRQLAPGKHPWMVYPTLNHQYQLCASYPGMLLAGPASLNPETNLQARNLLMQCAAFRSEHRLPVLTWSSGIDGASLWRASQPKVGFQGNRSPADELLLKHVLEAAASANALQHAPGSIPLLNVAQMQALTGNNITLDAGSGQPCLKIMDLRPKSAAMANRTGGYGYESVSNYPGATIQFCGIDNIHKVRDAYHKLSAVCTSPTTTDLNWNSLVEDTKWPSMVRLLLAAAWESAFWIQVYRYPVLLHCSHGWDRTSQVAALAQLMLDPFYRTREGFSTLVEKDFMSFGHPFHTRCAHGEGRGDSGGPNGTSVPAVDEGQISPIFIQFLDCVFQLVNQYPECFEFNTKYLLVMSEHVYSCRFGTFLCDTERERELVAGIRQRTHSLWDYLDGRQDVMNHRFNAKQAGGVMLMPLPTLLRNVTIWADRHCMHGPKATTRWLPLGIAPPIANVATDQHGSLVTAHEIQALILGSVVDCQSSPSSKEDGDADSS
ncbi:hypothetical protein MPSEU_001037600 [Mayamaea pseudoterrestris]|nr:hypothetical protein MPSEU_001037600 [Mayamaea pseudoterrestris]